MQHCAIFRNPKKMQRGREPKNTGREPGLKGTGSGRFKPPCPPPPTLRLAQGMPAQQKQHKVLSERYGWSSGPTTEMERNLQTQWWRK